MNSRMATDTPPAARSVLEGPRGRLSESARWLPVLAGAALCVSLLWDFSWESTIGIDLVWAPAHVLTYLSMAVAGFSAIAAIIKASRRNDPASSMVRLGTWRAPLGTWISLWGAAAFVTAVLFDRWWQTAYGLGAGIWHPPQILKCVSFFSVAMGAWMLSLRFKPKTLASTNWGESIAPDIAAGIVLVLITTVTFTLIYPNRQHSASFYEVACGTYPIILVAAARSHRFAATRACLVYTALLCLMVWILPLFPGKPQVAPVYNALDHLMPPPFPLLLFIPALGLDLILQKAPWPGAPEWLRAAALGAGFFALFAGMQWVFAEFLLSDLADNWVFAGGGRHWPFFLRIDPMARESFWRLRGDEFTLMSAVSSIGFAIAAARVGLWIGTWMKWMRR